MLRYCHKIISKNKNIHFQTRFLSSFIEKINIEINERKELGIPNVPLNTTQVNELCNLLE